MPAAIDLSGRKFGMLTAIRRTGKLSPAKQHIWECVCECGKITETRIGNLTQGRAKSCGCNQYPKGKNSANWKHGLSRTKEYGNERFMRLKYGITQEKYQQMLDSQNGSCAICKVKPDFKTRKKRFSIDHCHATGTVRGLLCDACNRGIGMLKDDPNILMSAIEYLSRAR